MRHQPGRPAVAFVPGGRTASRSDLNSSMPTHPAQREIVFPRPPPSSSCCAGTTPPPAYASGSGSAAAGRELAGGPAEPAR